MSLAETSAADLRAIIAEWPVQFVFGGNTYTGTVSGKNSRKPLEIGGFQDEPEISLVINLKDASGNPTFEQAPATGNDLIIGNHVYRIERMELDEFSQSLQFDLRSPNR